MIDVGGRFVMPVSGSACGRSSTAALRTRPCGTILEHDEAVVPTLAPLWPIETDAAGLGVSAALVDKAREAGRHMLASFEIIVRAGYGTDFLGQHGRSQLQNSRSVSRWRRRSRYYALKRA